MTDMARPRFSRAELMEVARQALARAFGEGVGEDRPELPASVSFAWTLLEYAGTLLDSGDSAAIAQAEQIIATALAAQETRPGAPDFGHFLMRLDDEAIADLNAVQLVMIEQVPLALNHRQTVSLATAKALAESIRAGITALDDIDAHLTYSNVAVLDVTNRILGGQFIDDPTAIAAGVAKLDAFIAYTNRHGGIRDYNSPTYLGQMINTLTTLSTYAADPLTRRKAELLTERIWLQAATHYHPALAQFAGPYSRAYPPDVLGEGGAMKSILFAFLDDERLVPGGLAGLSGQAAYQLATRNYQVPTAILNLFSEKALPALVREGSDRDYGLALTSYLGQHHALGTANAGFGSQACNLIVHAAPRTGEEPKILYSRFLAAGDERDLNTRDPRLTDWGRFAGVQAGNRAIGLFASTLDYRRITAFQTEFMLFGAEPADAVWTTGSRVAVGDKLAAEQWLFLDLGTTFVAIYALRPTHLGGDAAAPVSLHQDDGRLRLVIANYTGPAKYFWKYAHLPWEHHADAPGPFFNGHLRAGVLLETADAASGPDFATFRQAVAASSVSDTTTDGLRRVRWQRDGQSLELAVDMMRFTVEERVIDGQTVPGDVFLTGPDAAQLDQSALVTGGQLVTASAPGPWLTLAADGSGVIANPTFDETSVALGDMEIVLPAFSRGMLDGQSNATIDPGVKAVE